MCYACCKLFVEFISYFSSFALAPPSVPIWIDDLQCSTNDANIRLCPQATIGLNDCQHSDDIILSCVGRELL